MENLIFGIITITLCIGGYTLAFRQFKRNNVILALIFIMICGLMLRIFTSADLFLHAWDERYHALVAKNLINNPLRPTLYDNPVLPYDFKNWAGNHIWIHKQPFPLWTMALSMSVFGVNEIALRLPSILLTTLGIWITFSIARILFNDKVAIISAFLYSIHGLIIELTAGRVATDHIDVFFMFFVELSVLLAIKYFQQKKSVYNILCGISIGLAILSKWLPALIVLPIWLLLALDFKSLNIKGIIINFLILCLVIVAVALPWQIYIFNNFPLEANWESSFNLKHITEALEGHDKPFYYHFDQARIIFGELIYLPLIWYFIKTIKKPVNYRRLILSIWILIPFIFFSIARTKMQAYTIFTAPAIFMVTAIFWEYLNIYRRKFRFRGLIVLILFLLIALPARYSLERIKPFMRLNRNPEWARELRELDNLLTYEDKTVIFNTEYPVETMFYTDCTAYPGIPDSLTLARINELGYVILIRKEMDADISKANEGDNFLLAGRGGVYYRWKREQPDI